MNLFGALLLLLGGAQTPLEDLGGADPEPLERVCVIGASVTHGLDFSLGLGEVLDATLVSEHEPVESNANLLFFTDPVGKGKEQLAFVEEQDATLVIAVDFLFWFAYGTRNAQDERLRDDSERLGRLQLGLDLVDAALAERTIPIVLGDFPDMSESIGRQLHLLQVPSRESLKELNALLHGWAKEREHVILIPLATSIERIRADQEVTLGRQTWPAGSADLLLSEDRLHPTVEGTVAIAHAVAVALVECDLVAERDVDLDLAAVFDRLGEPVPEEVELPEQEAGR